jgi:hypothetical protein
MEIGGFFEFPKFESFGSGDSVYQHLKNANENFQLVRDGRQAIKTVLLNIKNIKNMTCFLPAYLCKSIIQPFNELNLDIKFYGLSNILKPELDEIKDSVVFVIDYFGRDTLSNKEIYELLGRNNILILDTTHSILNQEKFSVKEKSYYLISSLRKMFPIPDGGVIYSNENFNFVPVGLPTGYEKSLESMILRSFYINTSNPGSLQNNKMKSIMKRIYGESGLKDENLKTLKQYYLSLHHDYELEKFDDVGIPQNIPAISLQIMNNISYPEIVKKRKENLKFFYKEIEEDDRFLYDFNEIKSPFMLPLKFQSETERNSVKDLLIKNDIYPPLLWDLDEIVPKEYSYEHELRKRIMMIPIDQRYDTDNLSIVAELLNSAQV